MPEVDVDDRVGSTGIPPRTPWYETTAAIVVAGVGGVAAILAVVFAVVITSHQSVLPPQPDRLSPVTPAKSLSRTVTTSTSPTSRAPVSTSEDIGTSSAPPPPQEVPVETTSPPTTTMSNPYATTSAPNGAAF
ncbi:MULTISPECIES: hypothetical protein [Mycolicibacterium]|uniref:hypothetical protein n=1 Tax=Mycolicibacterium TaxID=1866885 RepID=UPI0013F4ED57|nr:hypothetical protein [Mycolicibacterium fortuitum]NOP94852.1 hypothetical protein [Mycolicibacterium fortuitum]UHJ54616.1 hypothetical protein LT337_25100 [Mycolicibacterium fortuitum]